jgi:hypothetical protein
VSPRPAHLQPAAVFASIQQRYPTMLCQGELRVAKENSRRMEDRMRGILKERTELVRRRCCT